MVSSLLADEGALSALLLVLTLLLTYHDTAKVRNKPWCCAAGSSMYMIFSPFLPLAALHDKFKHFSGSMT